MTGIVFLDVAIGIAYVFLIFSLIAMSIQEALTGILAWRAKDLKKGVKQLMGDEFEAFWESDLIDILRRPGSELFGLKIARRDPSYIEPAHFARAVMKHKGIAGAEPNAIIGAFDQTGDRAGIWLDSVAQSAGESVKEFEDAIATYFDQVMDRVKGWYVRRVKLSLAIIGLVLASTTNFNVFDYTKDLFNDGSKRAAAVAMAENIASLEGLEEVRFTLEGEALEKAEELTSPLSPSEVYKVFAAQIESINKEFSPTGWNCGEVSTASCVWEEVKKAHSLLAWILMGLAVMLGAQFWFDMLKRLVSVRSAGKEVMAAVVKGGETEKTS